VLMPYIVVSFAHQQAEVERTLEAATEAFQVYARALEDGVDKYLVGPPVKPVFRRFN
jgi:glutamate-1-semialdehyde 2,1-aminomutase